MRRSTRPRAALILSRDGFLVAREAASKRNAMRSMPATMVAEKSSLGAKVNVPGNCAQMELIERARKGMNRCIIR